MSGPGASARRVLLVGMMGAGKTTVGRVVAGRLGWRFVDADEELVRRAGRSIPEIFAAEGEPAFRAAESAVLAEFLAGDEPVVLALGGGAVLDPGNRAAMAGPGHLVVWLRLRPDTLAERLGSGTGRPLVEGDVVGRSRRLDAQRRPLYAAVADLVVDADDLTPTGVADRVVAAVDAGARPAAGEVPTCTR